MAPDAVPDVLPVIREMIGFETALAALYRACADAFPADRGFWSSVQHQEEGHARILERMAVLIAAHPDRFGPGRAFKPAAIGTLAAGAEHYAGEVRSGRLGREEALRVARGFEDSLLEARYAEVVASDDADFGNAVALLVAESERHKARFEAELARDRA